MLSVPMVRLLAQVAGSVGVSKIVNDVIRNNTNIVTTADAVRVWCGSVVIGSMITDHATTHINDRITDIIEWRQKNQTEASN